MKQLLQNMENGSLIIVQAPAPILEDGTVLIASSLSLISAGTERMLTDFGNASYINKARQQPEKVKEVWEKIKTDGFLATINAVRSKLEQPLPLGYCNVGVVTNISNSVDGLKVGDRVISNGPHADIIKVPNNLCVPIPDSVDDESAAFTVVASVGLQGVRLVAPTLGEVIVVIGVGLIGLLTVQLLKAHGCKVLAVDFDDAKLRLAKQFGAEICNLKRGEDPISRAISLSSGYGVDGVIITASTKSSDPIWQAARMSRKRGRIVLVGVADLKLNRSDFYEKELTFQVSCSYGPGRYDSLYEKKGLDYPIGFVRWTERRNFEAILDLMANKQLNVTPLITNTYDFEQAEAAYGFLRENKSTLGILLRYQSDYQVRTITNVMMSENITFVCAKPVLGVIGAGNYAARTLLPAFKRHKAQFHTIVTSGGVNATLQAKKIGFYQASNDVNAIFSEKTINTIVIVTRHDSHAELVVKALQAGKHVFVEKPLALNLEELSQIETAYHAQNLVQNPRHLMVGFNRRFSPHIQKIKSLLEPVKEPKVFIMTINALPIADNHWTQDRSAGGGRILGEACHFIDLMRFLAGHEIVSVQGRKIENCIGICEDKASIMLGFADGSFGTIHYLANGSAKFPKERIEIFVGGRILQLDNFRQLTGFGWPRFKNMRLWKQDKGQINCCRAFLDAVESGKDSPIPFNEIIEVSRITIEVNNLLRNQINILQDSNAC